MRISNKSVFLPFQNALKGVQHRKLEEEVRLTSGKRIINLSDDPLALVTAKSLSNLETRTSEVSINMKHALNEFYVIGEQVDAIGDKLNEIRQLAIDATSASNSGNLYSLGVYVKGILQDIVKDANADFQGHFLFSGTKTTSQSLDKSEGLSSLPFELIEEETTENNPSGLRVVFKGNLKERNSYIDEKSKVELNLKATQVFGVGGVEMFNDIVKLYNLLAYNPEGELRGKEDTILREDTTTISDLHKKLADHFGEMNRANGQNGAKIARLEALKTQTEMELTRLKAFRSAEEDTDYAESTINLSREETALQYALQIGARLLSNSLFDFLR